MFNMVSPILLFKKKYICIVTWGETVAWGGTVDFFFFP